MLKTGESSDEVRSIPCISYVDRLAALVLQTVLMLQYVEQQPEDQAPNLIFCLKMERKDKKLLRKRHPSQAFLKKNELF